MESFKLSRLNEYIQRVIALNFENPVWITAELIQTKLNKGHYYLELAERSDENEEIIAQSSAIIWKSNWTVISKKINDFELKAGINIKLRVFVEFHPKFGLKLNVQDIDPSYTLGEIAKNRQSIIARLINESIWQVNKSKSLPAVIKNIAVITSLSSAGRKDFEAHLIENPLNYTFRLTYFESSMQGSRTCEDIVNSLKVINSQKKKYDCVVIIRGGGAKLDLIEFDSYDIAKEMSNCEIPILTGIGHEQDESITDMSAYLKIKTPTAVAEYIIRYNSNYETTIVEKYHSIVYLINEVSSAEKNLISKIKNNIYSNSLRIIQNLNLTILSIRNNISRNSLENYQKNKIKLIQIEHDIVSNNPQEILKKGYTMTFQKNKRIKKKSELVINENITSIFEDGKIISTQIEL